MGLSTSICRISRCESAPHFHTRIPEVRLTDSYQVWEPATSKRLLKADDYAAAARESIKAMHAQVGDLCFTPDGIAKKGVLVRHLVMPGLEAEGARIMQFLAKEVSKDCFVNIMGTAPFFVTLFCITPRGDGNFNHVCLQSNTTPTRMWASPNVKRALAKRQRPEKLRLRDMLISTVP